MNLNVVSLGTACKQCLRCEAVSAIAEVETKTPGSATADAESAISVFDFIRLIASTATGGNAVTTCRGFFTKIDVLTKFRSQRVGIKCHFWASKIAALVSWHELAGRHHRECRKQQDNS
jgi:hypothetical protein